MLWLVAAWLAERPTAYSGHIGLDMVGLEKSAQERSGK